MGKRKKENGKWERGELMLWRGKWELGKGSGK